MTRHRNGDFTRQLGCVFLCVLFTLGCIDKAEAAECGDSILDAGEQCDDGNIIDDDGCSSICEIEEGWQCTVPSPSGEVPDGGFEAGTPNPFWVETTINFDGLICNDEVCGVGAGSGPADGTFWAWFGGVDAVEDSSLSQSIVFPSGALELEFELEVSICDSGQDYLELLIDGNQEYFIDGSSALCGNLGYTTQVVDISTYGDGASHDLEFHSESFSVNFDVSNFFVDNVSIPRRASNCTVINPALTLRNEVINDDGGTAMASDWVLEARGADGFSGNGPMVTSAPGFAAGTYDLLVRSDANGYITGDWTCVGGTQVDFNTIILAPGESAVCAVSHNDVDPDFQINEGIAGAWFNPSTAGQGQLIDVEPDEQFMFVSWFTYTDEDSSDPLEQHWLTAQGHYSGNQADLVLYETLGGRFDDPREVSTAPAGEVSLVFDDCGQGRMAYTIYSGNLKGEVPMQRAIAGSDNVCREIGATSTQAVDINAGMDGAWFDPNTSGQGFLIDSDPDPQGSNLMFVAWFTYGEDTASGQRWLTAQGGFDGPVAELDVHESTGGIFDNPKRPVTRKVGTISINFEDCNNAQLSYDLPGDGVAGDIDITRVIPAAGMLCNDIEGPE